VAGFLAGYSGLTRDAYSLDLRRSRLGVCSTGCTCSPPGGPTSSASAATGVPRASAGHDRSTVVHYRRVLPLRRRRRPARALPGRARAPTQVELRITRGRIGRQRGRCAARRGRARHRGRARPDLPAGDQCVADLRGLGAEIDKLGLERGHRALTVRRKGGKIVTIPLAAPRTARAIDLEIGERLDGPIFRRADGGTGSWPAGAGTSPSMARSSSQQCRCADGVSMPANPQMTARRPRRSRLCCCPKSAAVP
jgi:integrase/recombinase XerD